MMPKPLVNAIYAIAACVESQSETGMSSSDTTEDIPDPATLFEVAIESLQLGDKEGSLCRMTNYLEPTITRCQCLVILALQQHGLAEFSRAAVLMSMASAMAVDLRIHRATPTADTFQVEVQSRLWWNIFVLEKMIYSEMGRPVFLRSEETDTPLPSTTEADEFELTSFAVKDQHSQTMIRLRTISGFHTSIQLSRITEQISRQIYSLSARQAIRNDRDMGEQVRLSLWQTLTDWKDRFDQSPLKLDLEGDSIAAPVSMTNMIVCRTPLVTVSQLDELIFVYSSSSCGHRQ